MKVAITSTGSDLQSQVDPRFGRARYFIIVDPDTMACEAIDNTSVDAAHGAGIQSGQLMSSKGVGALITGSVGPNAHYTLNAANIKIYQSTGGTVQQALEAYKKGQLALLSQAGPAHAGMGRGFGSGRGRGPGMGGGAK